jgi:hypothetical protein
MRHTVEIQDTDGNTMQLSVDVTTIGWGGSWRALTSGMIKHHNGEVNQAGSSATGLTAQLCTTAGSASGVNLDNFISWGTVNEGTGTLVQPWCVGLTPGAIEWSTV